MSWIAPAQWVPRGLAGLEPAALDAVKENANATVVAGPGAGKTELLAQRASYLLETGICRPPFRILAISFKRDAASNLRERVNLRCGPLLAKRFESYTFDAWAKSLLDRFRLALPPAYCPTADYEIDFKLGNYQPLRDRLLSIEDNAGWTAARIYQLDVERFFKLGICGRPIDHGVPVIPGSNLALVGAYWHSVLHSGARSALNFSMIGALAELILRINPTILRAMRQTYRYVFLDEFQDTTGSQYRVLHTAFHGSASILTAVGDNKQRIMIWAGAQIGVFDNYAQSFAARPHTLVMNYRSAPRLVAIQHHLILALEPSAVVSQAADDGTTGEGECRLLRFSDSFREASYVGELVGDWVATGLEPSEICILTRQQPDMYTEHLRTELAAMGIFCRVQNELQDLLTEPLTVAVLNAFHVVAEERSAIHWQNLSALYLRLLGVDEDEAEARLVLRQLSSFLKGFRARLNVATTEAAVNTMVRELIAFVGEGTFRSQHEQYLQTSFFNQTVESLAKILSGYRSEVADWAATLRKFEGIDCVPIMSIHKSKGLEFHTVIMLGLEDYPFRGLRTGNGEEDCTFFVAFSRAKKRVIFTSTDSRTLNGSLRLQRRNDVARYFTLLENAGVAGEQIA